MSWKSSVALLSFIVFVCAQDPFQTFTLKNSKGMEVWVIPFGATVTHIKFPDNTGVVRDVLLGWDDATQYRDNTQGARPYFGALIGRYINRIRNGTITLPRDKNQAFTYHLPINYNGRHTLHGGDVGYDRRPWTVKNYNQNSIVLTLHDPDLSESFPGALNVTVTYTVTEKNEWRLDYHATSDALTVINLSNHAYWNLNGFANNSQDILDHVIQIKSDSYTPTDSDLIPTGQIESFSSVPWLDFRNQRRIGQDLSKTGIGYDNNYIVSSNRPLSPVVTVYAPLTGIQLQVSTTQPAVQFYTSNYLDGQIERKKDQIYPGSIGKQVYKQYSGFALETQHYPDSVHHSNWPSTLLRPGQVYAHTTLYSLVSLF